MIGPSRSVPEILFDALPFMSIVDGDDGGLFIGARIGDLIVHLRLVCELYTREDDILAYLRENGMKEAANHATV